MELNLTIDEQIQFLQGILDSHNRTMDTYEKSIYKEIIKNLKHKREYDIQTLHITSI